MKSAIPRVGPVPKHVEHVRRKINALVHLHTKPPTGLIIGDGKTIIIERLPDGRYTPRLHPSIRKHFK